MIRHASAPQRALFILSVLAKSDHGLTFTALSDLTGLGTASLSRLLKLLREDEWINRDEYSGRYVAGSALIGIGHDVRTHYTSPDLVAPIVDQLSWDIGQSACFVSMQQNYFMILAKTEVASSYHFMDAFQRNYDWCDNAMGQLLLANQTEEVRERVLFHCFNRLPSSQEIAALDEMRGSRALSRRDGAVLRVMATVRSPDGHVSSLIAVAALDTKLEEIRNITCIVQRAADAAEERLSPALGETKAESFNSDYRH